MEKTNAVRALEQAHIPYTVSTYEVDETDLSAPSVAAKAGLDIERVFKTLILRGSSGTVFVCVIPGGYTLDLKKAAAVAGEKKVQMIGVREIFPLTGYIRGGCSPVGMKRNYATFIDESCQLYDSIYVSAGVRGVQVALAPDDLRTLTGAHIADLV
ncbi:MAG: Cys-tRNA(Pro) deacylase [Sphaerochaetaceae bacterium]|nr:Cys-tRNA(Pro) deacylase [Sphaerochaetaceae bacterium]